MPASRGLPLDSLYFYAFHPTMNYQGSTGGGRLPRPTNCRFWPFPIELQTPVRAIFNGQLESPVETGAETCREKAVATGRQLCLVSVGARRLATGTCDHF